MTDLKSIVEEHIKIRKECKLTKLHDNTLFSEAVRRMNTARMDSRPQGSPQGPARQKTMKELNAPATDKQVAYMQELGLTIPAGITKEDAKVLISETLKKKKAEADSDQGSSEY